MLTCTIYSVLLFIQVGHPHTLAVQAAYTSTLTVVCRMPSALIRLKVGYISLRRIWTTSGPGQKWEVASFDEPWLKLFVAMLASATGS